MSRLRSIVHGPPVVVLIAAAVLPSAMADAQDPVHSAAPPLVQPGERRFGEMRQLTFDGENAEAYWSFDGTSLVFQSSPIPGEGCDQIYTLDPATGATALVSTGLGPDDMLLLLPSRRPGPLLVDTPPRRGLPGTTRPLAGLRVGRVSELRHIRGRR